MVSTFEVNTWAAHTTSPSVSPWPWRRWAAKEPSRSSEKRCGQQLLWGGILPIASAGPWNMRLQIKATSASYRSSPMIITSRNLNCYGAPESIFIASAHKTPVVMTYHHIIGEYLSNKAHALPAEGPRLNPWVADLRKLWRAVAKQRRYCGRCTSGDSDPIQSSYTCYKESDNRKYLSLSTRIFLLLTKLQL